MSKELISFDYAALDADTKGKLLSIARDVNREKAKHTDSGMEIGKAIATAHALLAGEGSDGKFSLWVEVECGLGRTTAYQYMWMWQRFNNCSSLKYFTQEALYALAAPKAPETALKEAVKLADKGVMVNKVKAKEILDRFRAAKPKARKTPQKTEPETTTPPETTQVFEPRTLLPVQGDTTEEAPKITGGVTFNVDELTSDAKDAFGAEAPEALREVRAVRRIR